MYAEEISSETEPQRSTKAEDVVNDLIKERPCCFSRRDSELCLVFEVESSSTLDEQINRSGVATVGGNMKGRPLVLHIS